MGLYHETCDRQFLVAFLGGDSITGGKMKDFFLSTVLTCEMGFKNYSD